MEIVDERDTQVFRDRRDAVLDITWHDPEITCFWCYEEVAEVTVTDTTRVTTARIKAWVVNQHARVVPVWIEDAGDVGVTVQVGIEVSTLLEPFTERVDGQVLSHYAEVLFDLLRDLTSDNIITELADHRELFRSHGIRGFRFPW